MPDSNNVEGCRFTDQEATVYGVLYLALGVLVGSNAFKMFKEITIKRAIKLENYQSDFNEAEVALIRSKIPDAAAQA